MAHFITLLIPTHISGIQAGIHLPYFYTPKSYTSECELVGVRQCNSQNGEIAALNGFQSLSDSPLQAAHLSPLIAQVSGE